MAASAKPISSIAMAFAAAASTSPSMAIPAAKPSAGMPHTSNSLPTPPNSISPTLPPHKVRSEHRRASHPPPIHVDSDIDLHDADRQEQGDHGIPPHPLSSAALSALSAVDPTGA